MALLPRIFLEVSLEEISNSRKMTILKKWICKYFVREKFHSGDFDELKKWVALKKSAGCRKDCHILRREDTKTGSNKVVCKVLGDFFVICGETAYKIVYVNELKLEIGARVGK